MDNNEKNQKRYDRVDNIKKVGFTKIKVTNLKGDIFKEKIVMYKNNNQMEVVL